MKILKVVFVLLFFVSCNKKTEIINSLTDDKANLENRIEELESEVELLEAEIDELNDDVESYKGLYQLASKDFDDLLESIQKTDSLNEVIQKTTTNKNTGYSQNLYNSSIRSFEAELSNDIETFYYDKGMVLKPTLNNIHLLLSCDFDVFKGKMKLYKYSLSTDKTSYVNDDANCCATIDKEYNSITMIFTKTIGNELELDLNSYNIPFNYKRGFKEYKYELNNLKYTISLRNSVNGFAVILTQI